MTHSFKLTGMWICSIALSGAAFADVTVQAEFRFDRTLSAEANYAAFKRVASAACAVPTRPELAAQPHIKACEKRLVSDAVAAIGNQDLIALHNLHNGAPVNVQAAALR